MEKTGVAIVGFGNIGQYAARALQETENMELKGVVEISGRLEYGRQILPDVTFAEDISTIDAVDIAILCLPSLMVPDIAANILKLGIHTVDCFDMHGDDLVALKASLHALSVENGVVSVSAAGWDPGTDSVSRALLEVAAPKGITYTDFAEIARNIKKDKYFAHDETHVIASDDIDKLADNGHSVILERKGAASQASNQRFTFKATVTNPAVTAQIMVNSAIAAMRQKPGNYLLIEIPPVDLLEGDDRAALIKKIV
jgi:diaminopimelate dehydrogenase